MDDIHKVLSPNAQGSEDYSRHLTNKKRKHNSEVQWKTTGHSNSKSTVIEIIDPVKSRSNPDCPNCNRKKSFLKRKVFANVFDRWTLELKLQHYHIQYTKSRNPLNILKKHFMSPVGAPSGTDWKFLSTELKKLTIRQLNKLRNAFKILILNREKELIAEKEERFLQTSFQKDLKKQLLELEALAMNIMKPYINLYPSCEELNRLMLA